ncbi:MAG: hypothetical protein QOE04_5453 [Mycobacterium sp.]|nr:hypothetical protein [Mycobacterium sp.]
MRSSNTLAVQLLWHMPRRPHARAGLQSGGYPTRHMRERPYGLRSGVGLRVRPEPGAVVERVEGVHVLGGELEFEDVGVLGDPLG